MFVRQTSKINTSISKVRKMDFSTTGGCDDDVVDLEENAMKYDDEDGEDISDDFENQF